VAPSAAEAVQVNQHKLVDVVHAALDFPGKVSPTSRPDGGDGTVGEEVQQSDIPSRLQENSYWFTSNPF
jgi:hypothetical protein